MYTLATCRSPERTTSVTLATTLTLESAPSRSSGDMVALRRRWRQRRPQRDGRPAAHRTRLSDSISSETSRIICWLTRCERRGFAIATTPGRGSEQAVSPPRRCAPRASREDLHARTEPRVARLPLRSCWPVNIVEARQSGKKKKRYALHEPRVNGMTVVVHPCCVTLPSPFHECCQGWPRLTADALCARALSSCVCPSTMLMLG
jgi:hypothetical protein